MKSDRPQNRNLRPWQPGQSGNPAGRPVGARSKLAEAFLEDFYAHWQKNGTTAIEELFENDKATYVKIAASIMPKEVKVDVELHDHLAAFLATMHDITPESAEPPVSPPKSPVKH